MSIKKAVACLIVASGFLCSLNVNAIMRGDAQQGPGSKGENQKKTVKTTNTITIKRATEFVQKIQNGVLYTDKNRYDLKGVKVIDHADSKQVSEPSEGRKRVAEMIFLNDILSQVIIHK